MTREARASTSSRPSRPTAEASSTARPATATSRTGSAGRSPGIYVVPAAGGKPVLRDRRRARCRSSARRTTASSSSRSRTRASARCVSIDLDGSDEREHAISAFATEFAVSPDEKWLAWTERFNAYVTPFLRTGKSIDDRPEDDGPAAWRQVTRDAGEYLHWSGDSQAPLLVARARALLARPEGRLRLPRRRAREAARPAGERRRTSASRDRTTCRPARSR